MKKIKISQLPLFRSLKGLYTIGTDKDNRSVRVSLEFIEEETNKAIENANTATAAAVRNAETATSAAQKAKTDADTATRNAQTATTNANNATTNARTATTNANNATGKANEAAGKANEASDRANQSALDADDATYNAVVAKNDATTATANATRATEEAKKATESVIEAINNLIPTGLQVEAVEKITFGNTVLNRVRAILTPENTIPNIIFISDNKAVKIDPQGYIRVVGKGESEIHIIPTCNTALAKTIIIRVGDPTAMLVDTRKKFRLTESGAIRLN